MSFLIISGVTAVGKTSTAKRLSQLNGWNLIEADDFHSPENIEKMRNGISLTDEDRFPWLQRLHEKLQEFRSRDESFVMTCSALKSIYRQILLNGLPQENSMNEMQNQKTFLVFLTLSRDVLHQRLIKRQNQHFMNPKLLDSQLEIAELPNSSVNEPNTLVLNCDSLSLDEIVEKINNFLRSRLEP